jgi:hypothetical protein
MKNTGGVTPTKEEPMSRSGVLAQAVAILTERRIRTRSRRSTCAFRCASVTSTRADRRRGTPETDEQLVEVGGVWNRRTKRWEEGESETLHVIRIPRGSQQEPAARYVAEWLRRMAIGSNGDHWDEPFTVECDAPYLPADPSGAKAAYQRRVSSRLDAVTRGWPAWRQVVSVAGLARDVRGHGSRRARLGCLADERRDRRARGGDPVDDAVELVRIRGGGGSNAIIGV